MEVGSGGSCTGPLVSWTPAILVTEGLGGVVVVEGPRPVT